MSKMLDLQTALLDLLYEIQGTDIKLIIGGGFGVGIHNILEASAFGLPVFMGPNYHKFNEAKELIELGGAFEVTKPDELIKKVNILLNNKQELSHAIAVNKTYVANGCGATEIVMKRVNELINSGI